MLRGVPDCRQACALRVPFCYSSFTLNLCYATSMRSVKLTVIVGAELVKGGEAGGVVDVVGLEGDAEEVIV